MRRLETHGLRELVAWGGVTGPVKCVMPIPLVSDAIEVRDADEADERLDELNSDGSEEIERSV